MSDHTQTHAEDIMRDGSSIGRRSAELDWGGGGGWQREEEMKGGWKGLLDKMGVERSERAVKGEAQGAGLIGNRAKQNK